MFTSDFSLNSLVPPLEEEHLQGYYCILKITCLLSCTMRYTRGLVERAKPTHVLIYVIFIVQERLLTLDLAPFHNLYYYLDLMKQMKRLYRKSDLTRLKLSFMKRECSVGFITHEQLFTIDIESFTTFIVGKNAHATEFK